MLLCFFEIAVEFFAAVEGYTDGPLLYFFPAHMLRNILVEKFN